MNGPVAKAFNCNYAALYNEIDSQRIAPCCLYAAENGAIGVTELLIRDAGFHPVSAGDLGSARMLEEHLGLMTAISEGGLGRFFYRYAMPGELEDDRANAAEPMTEPQRRVRLIFGALLLVLLLAALDQTIASTALPTIVGDLGGLDHLSWVVTAYLLTATVSGPLYGKLGDLFGRRSCSRPRS